MHKRPPQEMKGTTLSDLSNLIHVHTDMKEDLMDYREKNREVKRIITQAKYAETSAWKKETKKVEIHQTPRISDHYIIIIDVQGETLQDEYINVRKRDLKNYNTVIFQEKILEREWDMDVSDVDKAGQLISNIISTMDDICPIRTLKIKRKYKENKWMTNDVMELIKKRDNLYKKAKFTELEKKSGRACPSGSFELVYGNVEAVEQVSPFFKLFSTNRVLTAQRNSKAATSRNELMKLQLSLYFKDKQERMRKVQLIDQIKRYRVDILAIQQTKQEIFVTEWMQLRCLQNNLVVTQDIVRDILSLLDPEGCELRKRKPPDTLEDLRHRIVEAVNSITRDQLIRVWQEMNDPENKNNPNEIHETLGALSLNVQCLGNKIELIEHFIADFNFSFLLICEHWYCNSDIENISISNFKLLSHFSRSRQMRGGSSVFVKTSILSDCTPVYFINNLSVELAIECCAVAFRKCYCFISIYRPSSSCTHKIHTFITQFDKLLHLATTNFQNIIITGDLNIDQSSNDINTKKLFDIIHSFRMVSLITTPTRIFTNVNYTSSSSIDYVITNVPNIIKTENFDPCISDHHCQTLELDVASYDVKENTKNYQLYTYRILQQRNSKVFECLFLSRYGKPFTVSPARLYSGEGGETPFHLANPLKSQKGIKAKKAFRKGKKALRSQKGIKAKKAFSIRKRQKGVKKPKGY
ncbi:hypothetical protein RI129_012011 [Pyrocoelia pectoralis]|uniref:Endonuclease/exonuclease/phosphatase domain-containing protein n=1 Tax=Pyrocoelia pectoralis TaxID=417401 RepID=A0AAN7V3V4_9COLE